MELPLTETGRPHKERTGDQEGGVERSHWVTMLVDESLGRDVGWGSDSTHACQKTGQSQPASRTASAHTSSRTLSNRKCFPTYVLHPSPRCG